MCSAAVVAAILMNPNVANAADEIQPVISAKQLQQRWLLIGQNDIALVEFQRGGKARGVIVTKTRGTLQLGGQWQRTDEKVTFELKAAPAAKSVVETFVLKFSGQPTSTQWSVQGAICETYHGGGENTFQQKMNVFEHRKLAFQLAELEKQFPKTPNTSNSK